MTDYVITEDRWMRAPGGRLDRQDRKVIRLMGKGTVVINLSMMLDQMEKEEPEKYEGFKREMARQHGLISITSKEQLIELGTAADDTKQHFDGLTSLMHDSWAAAIREARVKKHFTWRKIARAFAGAPSQILGMSLCERAAVMFGEDYRRDPWN